MPEAANDSAMPPTCPPDAHGQAALLLVESLVHGLIARSTLSLAEAVEICRTALDVQVELMAAPVPAVPMKAEQLLHAIVATLSIDLSDGVGPSSRPTREGDGAARGPMMDGDGADHSG